MPPGERFNTYTHLFGFALSIVGMTLVLAKTLSGGDGSKMVAGLIFTLSSAVLYGASTLCHSMTGQSKARWQKVDHCAIHLLIAGSYTPFALVMADGLWCWVTLAAVWIVSILATVREIRSRALAPSVRLYIGMGWLVVAAAGPSVARMEAGGVLWLLTGAASYSVGTIFYVNRFGFRHAHGVWHLFVLGGTTSHFVAIAGFVL